MVERNEQLEVMLIKFYNVQAGTSFRSSNEANKDWAHKLLELTENDVVEAKAKIRTYCHDHPDMAKETMQGCLINAPKQDAPAVNENSVSSSLDILSQALIKVVADTSITKIEDEIRGSLASSVEKYILDTYGPIERKVVTLIDGQERQVEGVTHEKFETVLKFVANDEPVFLTGPAGSGKNHLCKQVADALNLKFYFTNAVTQEYKLTGFTDAMGHFQETQFYKAFTQGGLFMLDEMDASIPEVLVILNAAIANRYFDFPAPIGYVEAHPDFRVIAAGNTTGHGADYEYVGRNQLDAASLDRFAVVDIDYSKTIEDNMAECDMELANFCRSFRAAAKKAGLQIIVSYRAIGRLAKMMKLLTIDEALKTCLVKGIDKDDINIICKELPSSKFKDALQRM